MSIAKYASRGYAFRLTIVVGNNVSVARVGVVSFSLKKGVLALKDSRAQGWISGDDHSSLLIASNNSGPGSTSGVEGDPDRLSTFLVNPD